MMTIDDVKKRFSSQYKKYQALITETFQNQFKKELAVSVGDVKDFKPDRDTKSIKDPIVVLQMVISSDAVVQHVLLIDPKLALQTYAWLIEAEVEETVTDEHLDGLKESVNQVMGQLQASLSAESIALSFEIKDASYFESIKAVPLNELPQQIAKVEYTVEVEKMSFTLLHLMWSEESEAQGSMEIDDAVAELDRDIFPADFQKFNSPSINSDEPRNIDILMDVQLEIYVELGRKAMFIKDILKLSKGSIVELDKAAGEPLGMFVNGRKFAEGEVVVVDDQFGIRITQLIGPKERIKSLA